MLSHGLEHYLDPSISKRKCRTPRVHAIGEGALRERAEGVGASVQGRRADGKGGWWEGASVKEVGGSE